MLITFSGVDCAGKSTQIALLRDLLADEGRKVQVFWLRPGYSRELDGIRALLRRVRPGVLPAPGASARRRRLFQRRSLAVAWVAVALADLAFQYAVKIRWLQRGGRVIICDRFLDDALIDLDLKLGGLRLPVTLAASALRWVAARPDCSFLVMLSPDEIRARSERKREPFPDAEPVRARRYLAYVRLAAWGRYAVIEGAGTERQVHERIVAALRGATPRRAERAVG